MAALSHGYRILRSQSPFSSPHPNPLPEGEGTAFETFGRDTQMFPVRLASLGARYGFLAEPPARGGAKSSASLHTMHCVKLSCHPRLTTRERRAGEPVAVVYCARMEDGTFPFNQSLGRLLCRPRSAAGLPIAWIMA